MIRTRWVKRDVEWIRANPKKPTMYKEEYEDSIEVIKEIVPSPDKKRKFVRKPELDVIEANDDDKTRLQYKIRSHRIKRADSNRSGVDAGIYVFICEPAKRAYVGQSTAMGVRMRSHKSMILTTAEFPESYTQIRADAVTYGIDSFKFIKHLKMPNPHIDDLLREERLTILEFMNQGYTLYNRSTFGNMHCPEDYKYIIGALILKMNSSDEIIEKVKALID